MKQPLFVLAVFVAAIAGGYVGATLATTPSRPVAAPVSVPMSAGAHALTDDTIVDLVHAVGPAVVNIDTVSREQVNIPLFTDPFSGQAFGPMVPEVRESRGIGSGFVIDPGGLIITNDHVIQGATAMVVTFADGTKLKGQVLAADSRVDLAIVRVQAKNLPTLQLETHKPEVGQNVVAIGSPLGLEHSVSNGIISALGRTIGDSPVSFLQTDAAINPGNSGGPLIDYDGRVVGVNSAIAKDSQGIGFAIPSSVVTKMLSQLE
ncbi:MAG TPA: trypsin-like peptidase domain-containing protein [Oscillatoriaceae cyanobacterium]